VIHYLGPSTFDDATSLKHEIETVCKRRAILVAGDISDPATSKLIVAEAVKAFGRIDVLFSSAGICPFHSFLEMPDDLWKRVQAVNLDGSFYVTREVANQMAQQSPKGGAIVAISSISALVGGAEQTHYTPTKAGIKVRLPLACLTKTLAK
jgi:L-rhamnose 1-dehydrogenase